SGEKRVFLVILFTSFSGSLVSRIPGAVQGNSQLLSNQQEVATRQNQAFNLRWNDESNCKR
ncbi:hypothetical protein SM987_01765, partial [Escherichia coli]|nr:hypothetical protein [Escherichia coli]MEA0494823.1 hypothetical protein [Escherichia coli]